MNLWDEVKKRKGLMIKTAIVMLIIILFFFALGMLDSPPPEVLRYMPI